jgi:hypothetical protein
MDTSRQPTPAGGRETTKRETTTMRITVPAVPEGLKPAGCWRKTITGLDTTQNGGAQIAGEWLHAGDAVDLPAGTLILAVDKKTLRWDTHYRTGERYPVEEATITVHLTTGDGLAELWTRHYKQAKSAFGATTIKKITTLLTKHPTPRGEIAILDEAKRPSRKAGNCRWCGTHMSAGFGHQIGHGDTAQVEHYQSCPPGRADNGATCTLCNRTIVAHPGQAVTVMVRENGGRWETRHTTAMECTRFPAESWEEYQERRAAEQAEAKKAEDRRQKAAAKRAEKKAANAAEERKAHDAEQARIAGLKRVSRTERELNDKGIGDGVRAQLVEYTDTLEDGTTTTRWAVITRAAGSGWTGEDYDPDPGQATEYTRLEDARYAYRQLKWTPTPRPEYTGAGTCANCNQRGARHERRDSSGIPGLVCNRCDRAPDYLLSFA